MTPRKRALLLPVLLGLVFILFSGILVFLWIAADRADPVILDEKGNPR